VVVVAAGPTEFMTEENSYPLDYNGFSTIKEGAFRVSPNNNPYHHFCFCHCLLPSLHDHYHHRHKLLLLMVIIMIMIN